MSDKIYTALFVLVILSAAGFLITQKPETPQSDAPQSLGLEDQLQISPTTTGDTNMEQLKVEDIKIGTGQEVKAGDVVVMHYSGTFLDGEKFDSSYDRATPFETQIGVGQVIQGWDQGVPGMKVGGKRKLTIPYQLAYGENGIPGAIPPKATLVFEVELLQIK